MAGVSDAVKVLQDLSNVLFGQTWRLQVMIVVALSDGLVCQKDVQRALGLDSPSSVQTPLASLRNAGLLVPVGDDDSRRRWMRRADSTVWAWVIELADQHVYRPSGQAAASTGED